MSAKVAKKTEVLPKKVATNFDIIGNIAKAVPEFDIEELGELQEFILNRKAFEKRILQEIRNLSSEAILTESNNPRLVKLSKKIPKFEDCIKDFIAKVENARSPQEVDLYIGSLQEEQNLLFTVGKNPTVAKELLELRKKEKYFKEKVDQAKLREKTRTRIPSAIPEGYKAIQSAMERIRTSPLKNLHKILKAFAPEQLDDWITWNFPSEELEQHRQLLEDKIKHIEETFFRTQTEQEKKVTQKKINVFDSLIRYAQLSKLNFTKKINLSSWSHTAATILSLLSTLAGMMTVIPGANLIANIVSRSCEFFSFSALTAAHKIDPNIPVDEREAAANHYQAMKRYNIGETALGAIGTLGLLGWFAVAYTGIGVTLAPGLLITGSIAMLGSSFLSTIRAHKELMEAKRTLESYKKELDKFGFLSVVEKINTNTQLTPEEEIAYRNYYKANLIVKSYEAQYRSRFANTVGIFIASCAAITPLIPYLAPLLIATGPVGMIGILTIGGFTALVSLYSIYQKYKEKSYFKEAMEIKKEDELDTLIKEIIDVNENITAQPNKEADKTLNPAPEPEPELEVEVEVESKPPTPQKKSAKPILTQGQPPTKPTFEREAPLITPPHSHPNPNPQKDSDYK